MDEKAIRQLLASAREELTIVPGGPTSSKGLASNYIALAEAELKFHELEKADIIGRKLTDVIRTLGATTETIKEASDQAKTSSDIQTKQTEAMIFWTRAMVFMLILQVCVASFQGWVYYEQLKIMRNGSAHAQPLNTK